MSSSHNPLSLWYAFRVFVDSSSKGMYESTFQQKTPEISSLQTVYSGHSYRNLVYGCLALQLWQVTGDHVAEKVNLGPSSWEWGPHV